MRKLGYILISVGIGSVIGLVARAVEKRRWENWAYAEVTESDETWSKMYYEVKEERDVALREIEEFKEACRVMLDENAREAIFEQVKYKMSGQYVTQGFEDRMKKAARQMTEELGYGGDVAEPDDDGSEEFDDMPPLTPSGDIMDEVYDEPERDDTWTTDSKIAVSGDDIVMDKPYVISEWQFTYGKQHYTKVSLEYLCLDDTVLDEDETELDQTFIGPENLRAFETDDCDSIFIRNDQLQIDYELMWVEASYVHDILGYPEAEVGGRRIWRSWERGEKDD